MDAGLPFLLMASCRTAIALAPVARPKTPYPVMNREASSMYGIGHLPSFRSL